MTLDRQIACRTSTPYIMSTSTLTLATIYRGSSTDHQDNSLAVQEALNDEYCRRVQLPTLKNLRGRRCLRQHSVCRETRRSCTHRPAQTWTRAPRYYSQAGSSRQGYFGHD